MPFLGDEGGGGPVAASQVSVTNPGFANQQEVDDALLYVALAVTGFGYGLGVQLLGSVLADVLLRWSYNKPVVVQMAAGQALPIGQRSLLLAGVNLTASTSYALTASDGTRQTGAGTTVYFSNDRFWFVGPAGLNVPPPGAATDRPAGETRAIQFTLTAGAGQKIYYMRPARLGAGTYVVGGFSGGFIERTVPYTNAAGYTEEYIIGESTNTGLGLTTVTVN